MATTAHDAVCCTCKKIKSMVRCEGCSKTFCFVHIVEHHNELSEQLSQTENQFNKLKIEIDEQKTDLYKHKLMNGKMSLSKRFDI